MNESKKKLIVLLFLLLYNIGLILVCVGFYIFSINISLMLSISSWFIFAILAFYSLGGFLVLIILGIDYLTFKHGLTWLIEKRWKKRL